MTDRDSGTEPLTNEQAAELIRNEPALRAGSTDEDDNSGTDDDATTPDTAVTERD